MIEDEKRQLLKTTKLLRELIIKKKLEKKTGIRRLIISTKKNKKIRRLF